MNKILTDLSTSTIVAALHQNFQDTCGELCHDWKQAAFEGTEKQRRWWTPMPMALIFNAAIRLQPPAGEESDHIHETIDFFSRSGASRSVGG